MEFQLQRHRRAFTSWSRKFVIRAVSWCAKWWDRMLTKRSDHGPDPNRENVKLSQRKTLKSQSLEGVLRGCQKSWRVKWVWKRQTNKQQFPMDRKPVERICPLVIVVNTITLTTNWEIDPRNRLSEWCSSPSPSLPREDEDEWFWSDKRKKLSGSDKSFYLWYCTHIVIKVILW